MMRLHIPLGGSWAHRSEPLVYSVQSYIPNDLSLDATLYIYKWANAKNTKPLSNERFEVLMAVTTKGTVICNVMLCILRNFTLPHPSR
jgi:hypothetical protein